MDDFEAELQLAFREEATEHVQWLTDNLLKLEESDGQESTLLIEHCFRSLHNLKGSAHAVQYFNIESVCHPMEDIMFACKTGAIAITPGLIDLILEGVVLVGKLITEGESSKYTHEVEAIQGRLGSLAMLVLGHNKASDEQEHSGIPDKANGVLQSGRDQKEQLLRSAPALLPYGQMAMIVTKPELILMRANSGHELSKSQSRESIC